MHLGKKKQLLSSYMLITDELAAVQLISFVVSQNVWHSKIKYVSFPSAVLVSLEYHLVATSCCKFLQCI